MRANPGPGRLIVLEGLDGAGTTTQIGRLRSNWGERAVWATREPSDGPVGLQIRAVLARRVHVDAATLAALFAADRMDHLYHPNGILARLQAGVDVITDRYYLSSFAYQGISLDWDWLWSLHRHCIRPDLTLFLDAPVEVCLQRIAAGRGGPPDLFENRDALTQARQNYFLAIERLRAVGDVIEVVDGHAPPDQVQSMIRALMDRMATKNQVL